MHAHTRACWETTQTDGSKGRAGGPAGWQQASKVARQKARQSRMRGGSRTLASQAGGERRGGSKAVAHDPPAALRPPRPSIRPTPQVRGAEAR